MKNIIGGIEFPEGISARSASRYSIMENDGEFRPLVGWEFSEPELMGETTIIFTVEKIEDAAKLAFEWFGSRGHVDFLEAKSKGRDDRRYIIV